MARSKFEYPTELELGLHFLWQGIVIARGNNPSDYAEALVICASDQTATLALAAAQNSKIKERVFRILDHPTRSSV